MKQSTSGTPPKWPLRFLRWFCKPFLLEQIEGDLTESFEKDLANHSSRKAKWNYWLEVLGLFRPPIIRRINLSIIPTSPFPMIFNYLKIGFRQLRKYALFSSLNIIGLAVSMAVCLLVIMILVDQFSYDLFHTKKDRIYRVITDREKGEVDLSTLNRFMATTALPIAQELKEYSTEIEEVVRVHVTHGTEIISSEKILSARGLYVDSAFFRVFDFGKVSSNSSHMFTNPHSIILTHSLAKRLYGDQNPVGEILHLGASDSTSYLVTGLMEDSSPRTHMPFEFLVPFSAIEAKAWESLNDWEYIWGFHVYLLLADNAQSEGQLRSTLKDISIRRSNLDPYYTYHFKPQSLLAINPNSGQVVGNEIGISIPYFLLYFLAILGFIIMLSACFNYTNLSMARSLKRAKEIGIRKVIGGRRKELIAQFLIESILISILALGISLLLLELLIPLFLGLDPHVRQIFHFQRTPSLYLIFLAFSIGVGIVAGIFPALHLSKFQPTQVLKSLSRIKIFSFIGLRKGLLITQFTLCLIFLMSTILIIRQYKLFFETDHGFTYEGIFHVDLQNQPFDVFAQKARQIPEIEHISGSQTIPASGVAYGGKLFRLDTVDSLDIQTNHVTPNFIENLGITLIAGDNNPAQRPHSILLNELAVEKLNLGSPEQAIGTSLKLSLISDSTAIYTLVGVVKNFYDMDITKPASPYGLILEADKLSYANIRVRGEVATAVIPKLKKTWNELDPARSFTYTWYEDKLAERYSFLEAGSKIIGLVSILAIVIACLGLMGMVTYMVEGKVKEVGIRKILGASEKELIWRLSKGFLILLGIASLLSLPITFFLNDLWLETFAHRVSLDGGVILLGLGGIASLSLLMIISQTYQAARGNPVEALRSE